jgi:ERCC4-type nuclease
MVLIFKESTKDVSTSAPERELDLMPTPTMLGYATSLDGPLIDTHEPSLAKALLGQIGFQQYGLNDLGWADYYWTDLQGEARHLERKTWGELSDLDGVEEQIQRHLTKQPQAKLTWALEGVVVPSQDGYTIYKETSSKGRILFVATNQQRRPLKMVHSWLYQIGKYVEVHYTSSLLSTVNLITAMYQADQKPDHTTLHRYYRKVNWHPNPQVAKLMSTADGIGPVKAQAIIERFGTLWAVFNADPYMIATVPGIGISTARRILAQAGRPDV